MNTTAVKRSVFFDPTDLIEVNMTQKRCISISLTKDLADLIDKISKTERRDRSAQISLLLEKALGTEPFSEVKHAAQSNERAAS
jgi:hypothetical protein